MRTHRVYSIGAYRRAVPHHELFVQVHAPTPTAVRVTHSDGARLVRQWLAEHLDVELATGGRDALLSAHRPSPFRDEPPARHARLVNLMETLET